MHCGLPGIPAFFSTMCRISKVRGSCLVLRKGIGMRRRYDRGREISQTRCSLWLEGILVLLGIMVWSVPSLPGQTTTGQPQAPPVEGPSKSPAALPLSATERVLELSLMDAIRLTLQHNLDIERERFGPLIAHTEVEKARANFDPAVGLDASVANTKFLPTREFISVGGVFVPERPFNAN